MFWAGKKSLQDSFRSLFTKKEQAPSFSVPTPLLPDTYKRVEKLVRTWVDDKGYRLPDRTIEESAAHIGTDSATLFRYFAMRGEDFRSFRTRLRIQDAQELLLAEPETPASYIAQRVGYRDRGNFSNQFKLVTGLTPATWRAQHIISS